MHQQIIDLTGPAAEPYGAALGGAHALIRHGLLDRDTNNVNFVLRDAKKLSTARTAVTEALTGAGFTVTVDGKSTTKDFVRLNAKSPEAKKAVPVTLHAETRKDSPTTVAGVLVLGRDDAVAGKVLTFAQRSELRDATDLAAVAAAGDYSTAQLLDLAVAADPELRPEDLLPAFKHVTEREDADFTRLGCGAAQAEAVRGFFQGWFAELSERRSRPLAGALDARTLAKLAALTGEPLDPALAAVDPSPEPRPGKKRGRKR